MAQEQRSVRVLPFSARAAAAQDRQSDGLEQRRYATETMNLTYTQFLGRKADFTASGCNADHAKPGGCRKPAPYHAFDWTDDSCSPPTPPAWKKLFDGPCQQHDFGYRNFGKGLTLSRNEGTRAWIDGRFKSELRRLCSANFRRPWQIVNRGTCFNEAEIVWHGVRQGSFFGNDWSKPLAQQPPAPGPGPTAPAGPTPPAGPAPPVNTAPSGTGGRVTLAEGPAAPAGYRYAIVLSGYAANTAISITCFDSVSRGGFYTFSITTNGAGAASTASYCYSADGPDHWVRAGGSESNHVSWGGSAAPPPPTPPPPATYPETTGGAANTWTNHTNAGGSQGPTIPSNTTVQIACKLPGFRVADGNTWWYRIASSPWNSAYYVSADAFYNNGQTSGSLSGTPFVDPKVRDC